MPMLMYCIFYGIRYTGKEGMKTVLFICTHNSARSQMAEGWLRHLGGKAYSVHSAGTEKTSVRPEAIAVMKEAGVDITWQTSKDLPRYLDKPIDEVITVCDAARDNGPVFPNAKNKRHWSFPDPTQVTGTQEEILDQYRKIRDGIKERIEKELLNT